MQSVITFLVNISSRKLVQGVTPRDLNATEDGGLLAAASNLTTVCVTLGSSGLTAGNQGQPFMVIPCLVPFSSDGAVHAVVPSAAADALVGRVGRDTGGFVYSADDLLPRLATIHISFFVALEAGLREKGHIGLGEYTLDIRALINDVVEVITALQNQGLADIPIPGSRGGDLWAASADVILEFIRSNFTTNGRDRRVVSGKAVEAPPATPYLAVTPAIKLVMVDALEDFYANLYRLVELLSNCVTLTCSVCGTRHLEGFSLF